MAKHFIVVKNFGSAETKPLILGANNFLLIPNFEIGIIFY